MCASCASELPRALPGLTFSFLPADIVSQILNFGAPAPIDLQVRGTEPGRRTSSYANQLLARSARCRASPTRASSSRAAAPVFDVDVDRTRAQYVGLTDARRHQLAWSSTSRARSQVAPTYWLNPANGVSYPIVMQTPQYRLDSLAALANLPITAPAAAQPQVLGGIADISRDGAQRRGHPLRHAGAWCRSMPTTQGRDLGAVAADIRKVIAEHAPSRCRKGSHGHAARARCGRWTAPSPACCSACSAPSC